MRRTYDVKPLEAAAQAGTLQTLTYAPHFSPRVQANEPVVRALTTPPMVTMDELLRAPGVVYGVRIDDGQQVRERHTSSVAVGGQPGSGKTSTAAVIAAQHHHRGARILVGDPHAG